MKMERRREGGQRRDGKSRVERRVRERKMATREGRQKEREDRTREMDRKRWIEWK